jgi:hypothetical protein
MNKVKGTLVYVCLNEPTKAYVAAGEAPKADEWKASVVITDEDYLDEFEEYTKQIDAKCSIKKVKVADFEGKYKIPVPEGAGKYVWVLTFRKSTELGKTGKPVPELYRPRVFERQGNALVDITKQKLVGNGSTGSISLEVFERSNGTSSIYLKNVLVEDLIEYTKAESDYTPGSEFDDEDEDTPAEKPTKSEAEPAKEKPAARKPAKKQEEESDDPF